MLLDILSSDISVVGESDFTASSVVSDVAVNAPGAGGLAFYNPAGRPLFQLGDNLLIRKIWSVIPWGFGQGGPAASPFSHQIDLNFWDGADFTVIAPLYDGLSLPTLCDPLDFGEGLYCPMITSGPQRQIMLTGIRLRVSQINLPAALDGVRVPVQYFIEVAHTLPMQVA